MSGMLDGNVRDSVTMQLLSEVDLTLSGPVDRTESTQTGVFFFQEIPAAHGYVLEVRKEGYESGTYEDLYIHDDYVTKIDIRLRPFEAYGHQ